MQYASFSLGVFFQSAVNQPTGIFNATMGVLPRLAKHPEIRLVLFEDNNLGHSLAEVQLWQRLKNKLKKMIWFFGVLPHKIQKSQLEIYWGPGNYLPPFLSKSIARVVTIHDLVWMKYPRTMRLSGYLSDRLLMPASIRKADRIIAVSHSTAQDIKKQFPEVADRVRVVHLAASLSACPLDKPEPLSVGVNKPYILFVGTLEPRKNLRRLLEAFSLLAEEVRGQYQLVIAGGKGWGGIDVARTAENMGIASRVLVTGYVSNQQLAALYANAYLLAMPSLYEGFGLPILEANAFGVPVLTSFCSSMPEVAGDAAILVDPLNVQEMAEGLNALLSDRHYRDSLAAKAKKNAQRFSWEKAAQQTLVVFKEAMAKRN